VSNEAIQWTFKCQIGRLLFYAKWDDSMDFLSVKWGDYFYMSNGAIHYYMPNGAIKTIMSIGMISGSWSICISCICIINIESWVFVLIVYFRVMLNILN